jgi:hypothetical protein
MVAKASGANPHELFEFFASGMLLNVGAAIGVEGDSWNWITEFMEGSHASKT